MITTYAVLVGLLVALLVSILVRHRMQTKKLAKLRENWGKIPKISPGLDSAKLFFDFNKAHLLDCSYRIDDPTWHDLDFNEIFPLIDRTTSPIGSQYLYYLLRHPVLERGVLDNREKLINDFSSNSYLREQVQLKILQLASNQSGHLPYSLWQPLPDKPRYAIFLPVMSFVSMAVLALTILGIVHFAFPILVFGINLAIRTLVKRKVDQFMYSFGALGDLIRTARRITSLKCPEINEIQKTLSDNLKGTATIARKIMALQFKDDLGISEYLNIYFLWDVSSFYLALNKINKQLPKLRKLYETVGKLDALISMASFRVDYHRACRPSFSNDTNRYKVEDIYNPLLEKPVTNSFPFARQNVLITGSNMAGKTTFLKTMGVNAILAQTINWTMARTYEAPFVRVLSSIGREDNLVQGKSYYMAEVESILELVKASQADSIHLFILDEIYRGTNSTERLAASIEVLDYLANDKDFVLVATHDLQLSEMLDPKYQNFHFQEKVNDNGLSFDYKLRPGVSTTRNAITLLKHVGYPRSIVNNALDRVAGNNKENK